MSICKSKIALMDDPDGHDAGAACVFRLLAEGEQCFYCGDLLPDAAVSPAAMWAGVTATIHFHAACAERLGAHLIKDGMIAQERFDRAQRRIAREVS